MADHQVGPLQLLGQRLLEAEHVQRQGQVAPRGRLQLSPPDLQHQPLAAAAPQRLQGDGREGSARTPGLPAAPSCSQSGTGLPPPPLPVSVSGRAPLRRRKAGREGTTPNPQPPARAFPRLTRMAGGEETAAISSSKQVVPTVTNTDFMAARGAPQRRAGGRQRALRSPPRRS